MLRFASLLGFGAVATLCATQGCDWARFEPLAETAGIGGAGGEAGGTTVTTTTTSSGSGGGGGAAPTRCGGIEIVDHDFEPMSESTLVWFQGGSSGGASISPAGVAVLNFSTTTSAPTFETSYFYDFRDGSVAVEVVQPPDQMTAAATEFGIHETSPRSLRFRLKNGTLTFRKEINNTMIDISSVAYDPMAHRYWRLREDAGVVHFETAPDGASWTSQETADLTAVMPVERVRPFMRLAAEGTASGEAHFDNLRGEGPVAPSWCPVRELYDDFSTFDERGLWRLSGGHDEVGRNEYDGMLYVTLVPDTAGAGYTRRATQAYDLTDSHIAIELVQPPTAPATVSLTANERSNTLRFELVDDQLETSYTADGNLTPVNTITFDHDEHRWWRIREEGGAVHWETSADGSTWASVGLVSPTPIEVERLSIAFSTSTPEANPDPGQVVFDNFNVTP